MCLPKLFYIVKNWSDDFVAFFEFHITEWPFLAENIKNLKDWECMEVQFSHIDSKEQSVKDNLLRRVYE